MAVVYDSAQKYIASAASNLEKITKIDEVIDALLATMLTAAESGHIEEYQLNDGQTTIRTKYKDVQAIEASIYALERMKQIYVNRINGRSFRLVDEKNMR